jgi:hypothetical protein
VGDVGVLPELLARAPLAQQVPQPVELDVDLAQARALAGLHRTALVEQAVLLGHQAFDALVQLLIVHAAPVPARAAINPRPRPGTLASARSRRGRLPAPTKVREFCPATALSCA